MGFHERLSHSGEHAVCNEALGGIEALAPNVRLLLEQVRAGAKPMGRSGAAVLVDQPDGADFVLCKGSRRLPIDDGVDTLGKGDALGGWHVDHGDAEFLGRLAEIDLEHLQQHVLAGGADRGGNLSFLIDQVLQVFDGRVGPHQQPVSGPLDVGERQNWQVGGQDSGERQVAGDPKVDVALDHAFSDLWAGLEHEVLGFHLVADSRAYFCSRLCCLI